MCKSEDCLCEDLREALKSVWVPGLGMNVVDLGFVHRIQANPAAARVEMTLASPARQVSETLIDEVKSTLARCLPIARTVDVQVLKEPPWSPWLMSESARRHFGWSST